MSITIAPWHRLRRTRAESSHDRPSARALDDALTTCEKKSEDRGADVCDRGSLYKIVWCWVVDSTLYGIMMVSLEVSMLCESTEEVVRACVLLKS